MTDTRQRSYLIAAVSGVTKQQQQKHQGLSLDSLDSVMNYFADLMLIFGEAVVKLNNFLVRIAFLATKIEAKIKCYECFTNYLALK